MFIPEPKRSNDSKVSFTPEQQAKINDLIRDAMGRAGREGRIAAEQARNESKALKAQLAALRGDGGNNGDDEALIAPAVLDPTNDDDPNDGSNGTPAPVSEPVPAPVDHAAELEATRAELRTARQERNADLVSHALVDAARSVGVIDPSVAADLLRGCVKVNSSGQLEVVTEGGTPRLGSDFTPLTIPELLREFASQRPYLVRGGTKSGAGSTEAQRSYTPEPPLLSHLFGRGSSGMAANKLKKSNPQEYARLKNLARERGLVG